MSFWRSFYAMVHFYALLYKQKDSKTGAPHKEVLREWCSPWWAAPFSYADLSDNSEMRDLSSSASGTVKRPIPVK